MKFNILYLHETAKISGAEKSLLNLIRLRDSKRFESYFVLPEKGPLCSALQEEGVRVFIISMPRIRNTSGVIASAVKILKIAVENNIHLLHTNSIRAHIYGTYVAKKKNIPIVWHERNLITNELIDPDKFFSFLPDKIICNSYAIAKRFIRSGARINQSKTVVIYNGVDTERFKPGISGLQKKAELGIKADDVVIGIASRFSADKGHETFLKSAKIILNSNQYKTGAIRFLVAGGAVFDKDMWREDYLKKIARDLGLGERVIFAGFCEDMPQVYAAMDIFVLASLAEPCGRVILEAMSMGKPIVATNTGGTPEIVIDRSTGILIPPRDPDAMAESIIYLLKNRDIIEKMGSAGRKRAEELFDIANNVKKTEAIYSELLSKK